MDELRMDGQLIEAWYMQAARLYECDRTDEALQLLLELVGLSSHVGVPYLISQIYYEAGELDLAIHYSRQATQQCPYSEKSSWILHHALIDSGDRKQAWEEIERYFSVEGIRPDWYLKYLHSLAEDLGLGLSDAEKSDTNHLIHQIKTRLQEEGTL